ncbi:MAG: hypothetical protein Q9160_007745 [Pyrenula sp. 1 TL-2023]
MVPQVNDYQRRQVSTESSLSESPTNDFPPSLSTLSTSSSVQEASIDKSWIDTTILPPNFPDVNTSSLNSSHVPQGFSIKCKECSLKGTVDIEMAELHIGQPSEDLNASDSITSFLHSGLVELSINGFAAGIELDTHVLPSPILTNFTANFPDIAIPGFSIPGIATVGPVLRPRVTFGVQLSQELDFTYGFNLSIPDNSSIILDLANLTNSSVSGLQNTAFHTLPFNSPAENIDLTMFVAFQPELLLTISLLDNSGTIDTGVTLNLPLLTTTINQVEHVNGSCKPFNSSDNIYHIYSRLAHVVPTIDFGTDLIAGTQAQLGGQQHGDQGSYMAFRSSMTLPTACLDYDPNAKAYISPTATLGTDQSWAGHSDPASIAPKTSCYGVWWIVLMLILAGRF